PPGSLDVKGHCQRGRSSGGDEIANGPDHREESVKNARFGHEGRRAELPLELAPEDLIESPIRLFRDLLFEEIEEIRFPISSHPHPPWPGISSALLSRGRGATSPPKGKPLSSWRSLRREVR